MTNVKQKRELERWRALDRRLGLRDDSGQWLLVPQFAKEHGVDRKTVYRDLDLFRSLGQGLQCRKSGRRRLWRYAWNSGCLFSQGLPLAGRVERWVAMDWHLLDGLRHARRRPSGRPLGMGSHEHGLCPESFADHAGVGVGVVENELHTFEKIVNRLLGQALKSVRSERDGWDRWIYCEDPDTCRAVYPLFSKEAHEWVFARKPALKRP
jgi:hypothetical protein